MAKHQPTRKITRETRSTIFECGKVRTMILEWERGLVSVRPKGTRRREYIDIAGCWQRAVKARVWEEKRKAKRPRSGK